MAQGIEMAERAQTPIGRSIEMLLHIGEPMRVSIPALPRTANSIGQSIKMLTDIASPIQTSIVMLE